MKRKGKKEDRYESNELAKWSSTTKKSGRYPKIDEYIDLRKWIVSFVPKSQPTRHTFAEYETDPKLTRRWMKRIHSEGIFQDSNEFLSSVRFPLIHGYILRTFYRFKCASNSFHGPFTDHCNLMLVLKYGFQVEVTYYGSINEFCILWPR